MPGQRRSRGAPPGAITPAASTARAAGNPGLLSELAGGLRDEGAVRIAGGQATLTSARLPGRVRRAARERLDGVSGQARQVLTTAAVLGGSFSFHAVDLSDCGGGREP